MDKSIKPCLCGNTSIRVEWHVGLRIYSLWCYKCKREIRTRSKKEAIDLWEQEINDEKGKT